MNFADQHFRESAEAFSAAMATSQTIDVHQTDLGLSQIFAMANIHEKA